MNAKNNDPMNCVDFSTLRSMSLVDKRFNCLVYTTRMLNKINKSNPFLADTKMLKREIIRKLSVRIDGNVNITRFDPRIMGRSDINLVIGQDGSIKRNIMTNMLEFGRAASSGRACGGSTAQSSDCVIINGSEDINGHYGLHFPEVHVHNEFKNEIVDEFVNRQIEDINRLSYNPNAFLLIDDVCYNSIKNVVRRPIFTSRYLYMTIIIGSQCMMDMTPDVRGQIDRVFVLGGGGH